jgi:hypothetical protein
MAYIGKSIESGTFSVLDTSGNTYNGSNTTFSLGTQVGSAAQLLVSHDGVIQKPGTDYTLASGGTQITFSTAPASGASIFIVEISGAVGGPLDSDLNGNELILDTDGDTSLHADTDDQIDVKIGGTDQFSIKDGVIEPTTDNDVDIGASSKEFKDGYFDGTLHCDVLDLAGTEYTSIGQGKIGQVIQTNKTDTFSTTSSSFVDVTGFSASITPSASSSKVLVIVNMSTSSSDNSIAARLYRGSTLIGAGDGSSNRSRSNSGGSAYHSTLGNTNMMVQNITYLDSPSTTSSTTYKIQGAAVGGGTLYYGRTVDDTDNVQFARTPSTITLMEVLA